MRTIRAIPISPLAELHLVQWMRKQRDGFTLSDAMAAAMGALNNTVDRDAHPDYTRKRRSVAYGLANDLIKAGVNTREVRPILTPEGQPQRWVCTQVQSGQA